MHGTPRKKKDNGSKRILAWKFECSREKLEAWRTIFFSSQAGGLTEEKRERNRCAVDGGHGGRGKMGKETGTVSVVSSRFISKSTNMLAQLKQTYGFIVNRDSLITILITVPKPNATEINERREYIHNLWSLSF